MRSITNQEREREGRSVREDIKLENYLTSKEIYLFENFTINFHPDFFVIKLSRHCIGFFF
jgi:hypothetical protein